MDFQLNFFPDRSFHLTLVDNINDISVVNTLDCDSNIIVLNPQYIISINQIKLALHRALYNFQILKKKKQSTIKREMIYLISDKNKMDQALKMHSISEEQKAYYFVFIDKKKEEIDKVIESLKGVIVPETNYTNYINFELIRKEFEINDDEFNNECGIIGAIFNRLAVKDLK